MQLSGSTSDLSSALQPAFLTFGLSKSPFQSRQLSVLDMHSGALSSSLSAEWLSIVPNRRTFDTWIRPPGRSFADKVGGKGAHSDNLNAAAPLGWKFDQDALIISSVSEMYPTTVIWSFTGRVYICVVGRFWLPCHIFKIIGSWPFCVIFFPPPLSSIPSCFQCLCYWMLCNRPPIFLYWLKQTILLWLLPTASHQ